MLPEGFPFHQFIIDSTNGVTEHFLEKSFKK